MQRKLGTKRRDWTEEDALGIRCLMVLASNAASQKDHNSFLMSHMLLVPRLNDSGRHFLHWCRESDGDGVFISRSRKGLITYSKFVVDSLQSLLM